MLKAIAIIAALALPIVAHAQSYPEMVSGVIIGISPPDISIEISPGKQLIVDMTAAKAGDHIGSPIEIGRPVVVHGFHHGDKFMASAIHKGLGK